VLLNWRHGLSVRFYETKHLKWKYFYLTLVANQPIKKDKTVEFLFSNLYHFLKNTKAKILFEKIYGTSSLRNDIAIIRNHYIDIMGERTRIPFTYIRNTPCVGGKIAGVQIIGVIQDDKKTKVDTISFGGESVGRVFETDDFKEIYLSRISGLPENSGSDSQCSSRQAEYAIKQCQNILSSQGLTVKNIVRTWVYLPKILRWYKKFNKIREKFFMESGLINGDKTYLPASTGIQGRGMPKEDVFLDLIAFISKKKHINSVSIMKSNHQGEARKYGSAFSRGVEIKTDTSSLLHISGTSSINREGKTVYINDEQGQIMETLINVAALLETRKAHLKDIVLTTVYCKNRKTYKIFKEIIRYLGLDGIPFIPVFADICRDQLLFEIDAIAVKQHDIKKKDFLNEIIR